MDSRQNGGSPWFAHGRQEGFALTSHALATEIKHQQHYPCAVSELITPLE